MLLSACQVATMAVASDLPEPLTLEYALSLVDEAHPDLELANAERDLANAGMISAESLTGINASLEATARWIEPGPNAQIRGHNDSQVSLLVSKNIYDFGRSSALMEAAQKDIQQREHFIDHVRNQRRIDIMARYFDVLLADLEFIRDNEEMSIHFIQLERTRDRHALGQVSDIDLRHKDAIYQTSRRVRYDSQNKQRIMRARLALSLNHPDSLSSTLALPNLQYLERELPEVKQLQEEAAQNNPVIFAMRAQLDAAQSRVKAAHAGSGPVLKGEFEASAYERQFGSRDDVQAGIVLQIPLTTGGSVKADIAREQANTRRYQAELVAKQREVNQKVLELWLELETLNIQRDEMKALIDYRDLYLDRSRALYEMEIKTDLGDAMVQFSDARLREAQTRYAIELAWARLDALLGRRRNEN